MIALGCGGAGCLGLIVVAIAAGLIYFFSGHQPYYTNRPANSNVTVIGNSNTSANENSSSSSSSSTSVASMPEDDKHKLYQAAMMTGDAELGKRVSIKLGLLNDDNTPTEYYEQFITGHIEWAPRNLKFIQSIGTPEKARAYVDLNLPD
jgi:hypothetical protein